MYTDPIADLLTRIRNGYKARKDVLTVPHSKMKLALLQVLKKKNFISDFSTVTNDKFEEIEVKLNDDLREISLKKVSKPGQRIYVSAQNIKKVNGGLGLAVISTSKGLMSGEEAQKQNIGGELICEVY
jgi:small subunit ribosomal protein S8